MKFRKILCLTALALLSSVAFADTTSNSSAETQSNALAQQGNAQAITFNSNSAGTQTVKTTGTAFVGGYSNSYSSDYCSGVTQVGGGGIGFAFSAGTAVEEKSCQKLRTTEKLMNIRQVTADPVQKEKMLNASLKILGSINDDISKILVEEGLIKGAQ
jgi:histidinol dehydrogenase